MKNIFVMAIILLSIFIFGQKAIAYNVGEGDALGTHELLSGWSYKIAVKENAIAGINSRELRNGSRDQDDAPNWLWHFYNPATGKGLLRNRRGQRSILHLTTVLI